jgi:hypothetical protein
LGETDVHLRAGFGNYAVLLHVMGVSNDEGAAYQQNLAQAKVLRCRLAP